MVNKKAQLFGMPYAVIFSIILIVFFIIAAWIAIGIFWNPGCECAFSDQSQEGLFKDDLQTAVDDVWNSAGGDRSFEIKLPGKIDYVCFFNYDKDSRGEKADFAKELKKFGSGNIYLYPGKCACEGFRYWSVKHVNITETTRTNNPLCIENNQKLGIRSEHGGLVEIYKK